MAIFWRLLLSHLLADFTLQFDIVNKLKRKHIWGMGVHCLTHFVVSAALTWRSLGEIWFSLGPAKINGWEALLIMLACHFIIDELRIYSMKKMGYRDDTASILVDQFMHVYVLFMISPVVLPCGGRFIAEKWVGIASIFVLITHVATVLIYFVEKDLSGKEFPSFDEKYFMIFERIVLWAFFFAAGWWWLPFAAAWAAQLFYIRGKRIIDLSLANIFISLAITLPLGLWTRYIYYGRL
ncbi:MAG: DUF3307 domain-containing protein [Elusimicrobiales bacterium]|jgi:hypothetical protein